MKHTILYNKMPLTDNMSRWQCTICGYIYDENEGDPESGIEPGTEFNDLPEDWECPICGAAKEDFEPL